MMDLNSTTFAEDLEAFRGRMNREEALVSEIAVQAARHMGAIALASRIVGQVEAEMGLLVTRVARLAPPALAAPTYSPPLDEGTPWLSQGQETASDGVDLDDLPQFLNGLREVAYAR